MSKNKFILKVREQLVNGNPFLLHGIAVPDGNAAVLQRVEVDGDAEGGSNLILPAIPLPYTCLLYTSRCV